MRRRLPHNLASQPAAAHIRSTWYRPFGYLLAPDHDLPFLAFYPEILFCLALW